ncbi:hypothetical protein GCM10009091_49320 [Pseudomonas brenneri]|uniref:Uncharacterized protein n=1 Tax=Pseudomonas brenneri TaxID=129817 RepID=A0A5B2UJP5_9PSED|nr:hypothetical protein [Pseudomonas brenneri]KAA2226771.1 hypothetical protein F1720_25195 [Pseudomonas brenneri]TWR74826.1 hypothetical protein FJD34_25070 [Pseudomonas brenneri]GGL61746.1 hypothetical protein GCM10009091_49320 [Pseudomonas brenneri]
MVKLDYLFALAKNLTVTVMSAKTAVMAIRVIGEEVVRLLSLTDEDLELEAHLGLQLIGEIARWRDLVYELKPLLLRAELGRVRQTGFGFSLCSGSEGLGLPSADLR